MGQHVTYIIANIVYFIIPTSSFLKFFFWQPLPLQFPIGTKNSLFSLHLTVWQQFDVSNSDIFKSASIILCVNQVMHRSAISV